MTKLKKCQRVEVFLNKLLERDDFELGDLEALNYRDINQASELEGIGDRTISNVLNAYKSRKGINKPENIVTKKQKVENYLSELLESGAMTFNEILRLGYNDLKDEEDLADIGKTTITCALAEFKQNNDVDVFEQGVLEFLASEKKEPVHSTPASQSRTVYAANRPDPGKVLHLQGDNVKLIKRMINEFKQLKAADEERKKYELRELKHALHFVGIDPSKIVRLYWEDLSKDFMNRKILAGSSAPSSSLNVGEYV